jgi:predicted O-methyltransferase YrrM
MMDRERLQELCEEALIQRVHPEMEQLASCITVDRPGELPLSDTVWWDVPHCTGKMWTFLYLLAKEYKGGTCVEIGTYDGNGTYALAKGSGGSVYSIDPTISLRYQSQRKNPDKFSGLDITWINALSVDAVDLVPSEIDILFIDGDHSYAGVKQDFELYAPKVKKTGLIILDDTKNKDWPGVAKFMSEREGLHFHDLRPDDGVSVVLPSDEAPRVSTPRASTKTTKSESSRISG